LEDYRKALLDEFINEAEEKIEILNNSLLELEKDPGNKECINNIFRATHTLKGGSAAMGFENFTQLTHAMEDIFHYIRNDKLQVTPNIIDVFFTTSDFLKSYLAKINSNDFNAIKIDDILEKLENIISVTPVKKIENSNQKNVKEKTAATAINSLTIDTLISNLPENILKKIQRKLNENIDVFGGCIQLKEDIPMNSLIVFMLFTKLGGFGTIIWSDPPVELSEDYDGTRITFVLASDAKKNELLKSLKIPECKSLNILAINLDALKNVFKTEKTKNNLPQVSPVLMPPQEKPNINELDPAILGSVTSTLKVDSQRVDNLLNLVGELLINRSRFSQVVTGIKKTHSNLSFVSHLNETVTQLKKITNDLQEGIMQLRMIKINQIFNKFPRLVRDISRKLDKKINLEITGQETELDKRVIEEIRDPIMHIVRNCVDHGIETYSERSALGKPENGTLRLDACHEGNQIVIKISDDGRGIDLDLVKQKAIELGMINKAEAQKMLEQEILYLILQPGFSTSTQVNDLSGRGVGMDIVKRNIEKLNGTIKIISEINKGTTFLIKLPLTLAIIPTLLVKINNGVFAVPLSSVTEIIEISTNSIKMVNGNEMIALRDLVIPLIRLNNYFNPDLPYKEIELADVAIINIAEQHVGLVVDACMGEQEIVIKSLTSELTESAGISGAAILGDGTIALIIDVATIIRRTAEINNIINMSNYNKNVRY